MNSSSKSLSRPFSGFKLEHKSKITPNINIVIPTPRNLISGLLVDSSELHLLMITSQLPSYKNGCIVSDEDQNTFVGSIYNGIFLQADNESMKAYLNNCVAEEAQRLQKENGAFNDFEKNKEIEDSLQAWVGTKVLKADSEFSEVEIIAVLDDQFLVMDPVNNTPCEFGYLSARFEFHKDLRSLKTKILSSPQLVEINNPNVKSKQTLSKQAWVGQHVTGIIEGFQRTFVIESVKNPSCYSFRAWLNGPNGGNYYDGSLNDDYLFIPFLKTPKDKIYLTPSEVLIQKNKKQKEKEDTTTPPDVKEKNMDCKIMDVNTAREKWIGQTVKGFLLDDYGNPTIEKQVKIIDQLPMGFVAEYSFETVSHITDFIFLADKVITQKTTAQIFGSLNKFGELVEGLRNRDTVLKASEDFLKTGATSENYTDGPGISVTVDVAYLKNLKPELQMLENIFLEFIGKENTEVIRKMISDLKIKKQQKETEITFEIEKTEGLKNLLKFLLY